MKRKYIRVNAGIVRWLYEQGHSTRDIADLLGIAKSRVGVIVKKAGLSRDHYDAADLSSWKWGKPESPHWRTKRQQARKLMEDILGYPLRTEYDVHHKDGDYTNNSLDNLEVVHESDHLRHHHLGKKKKVNNENPQE